MQDAPEVHFTDQLAEHPPELLGLVEPSLRAPNLPVEGAHGQPQAGHPDHCGNSPQQRVPD